MLTLVLPTRQIILIYENSYIFIQFLTHQKMNICDKLYHNASEGTKLLHGNGKKWLLSKAAVSAIFDLLVNPEIMEKNEGWGFFSISRIIWG